MLSKVIREHFVDGCPPNESTAGVERCGVTVEACYDKAALPVGPNIF